MAIGTQDGGSEWPVIRRVCADEERWAPNLGLLGARENAAAVRAERTVVKLVCDDVCGTRPR